MADRDPQRPDEQDDGFLSRWARRKQGNRRSHGISEATESGQTTAPFEPAAEQEEASKPIALEDLPDIESLDENSDFSLFLREGVPDVLRRRALRKLWRLNPVLANLDGLNDYDEDFTDAATVVAGLKTLYQVGKGVVLPEEEEPREDAPVAEPPLAEAESESEPDAPAALAGATVTAEAPAVDDAPADPPAQQASGKTEIASDSRGKPQTHESGQAVARRWHRFET